MEGAFTLKTERQNSGEGLLLKQKRLTSDGDEDAP
jgi:hypothetical protein